jgi:small subunit ribosomal protein S20
MANSAGSRRRARVAVKRNIHNSQIRTKVRSFIKKVTYAIQSGDKESATANFAPMQKTLDQAVSKGLYHKNLAARKKSRLSAQIKAL